MSEGVLKMKDLESRTGVSRESIHFYLREGLLPEPSRPKRNVAHYSEQHVVRIKAIKRLQEERFLPLGVIKSMLDEADFGSVTTADDLPAFELAFLSLLSGDTPSEDRPLREVAAETGLAEAELTELGNLGVINLKSGEGGAMIDYRDAAIVEQWARLRELGYDRAAGYGAGFLKRYADTIKVLADAEVDEFLDAFGDIGTDAAADLAVRGIEISNEIITRLHTRALTERLNERAADRAI